jgi:hypothetical protein
MAVHWPDVVQVLPDLNVLSLELWLDCYPDVRHNRRIRFVMDFLAEQLRYSNSALLL